MIEKEERKEGGIGVISEGNYAEWWWKRNYRLRNVI
jgi:hypothetical protein